MADEPNPGSNPDDPGNDPGNDGGQDPGKQQGSGKQQPTSGKSDVDIEALQRQLDELSADRDKWKAASRKHEERAKTNADAAREKKTVEEQLAELRSAQEQRDAADLADKADLAAEKLQASLVRGGLSDDDAATLVGTIDPVRLLNDGKPDTGAITKLAESLVKIGTRPAPDRDQGRKGGDAPPSMSQLIRQAAQRTRVG